MAASRRRSTVLLLPDRASHGVRLPARLDGSYLAEDRGAGTAFPPLWLFRPTLQNYVDVFANNPFFLYMMNSTLIAVSAVGVCLLTGLPAA
jgi:ABC-type glycerol-3-phosphate transport system permease component